MLTRLFHPIRVYLCSFVVKNKNPTAVLAMGSEIFERNQNPTATRRNSSVLSRRFRFKLRFTRST